jgi:molybdenum cofactor synthesis domain-containing protein
MKASTYPLLDASEVERLVLELTPILGAEELPLERCRGRVPAADILADRDLPAWPASAVDGYAVRSADRGGSLRVIGEAAAGRPFDGELEPGTAARILTGGVLPAGADAVVMVEDTREEGVMVTIPDTVAPGANYHQPGADLRRGDLIAARGEPLDAARLALAASVGLTTIAVHRRPRVALMSTGDELVEPGGRLGPGQIYDSNRFALGAVLEEAGAKVVPLGLAPDEPETLRSLVVEALKEANALVTSGGVSVGTHDLVKPLLERLGDVHVGRVKLKPGKPFTFATLPDSRVAFGLPGFPVSSLVTFEVFVRPALRRMQGFRQVHRPRLQVRLDYDARAPGDRTEYQRVTLKRVGGELVASSTGSQSSSRLMSLVGAHAFVLIPPGGDGIAKGTIVDALILDLPA